jgi:hypothetical protein
VEATSERLAPAPRRGGRYWLTWGLLVHLLTIALVIAPAFLPVPVEAAKIGLFFTEGVTLEDRATARKAIDATVKYFETNYQLGLNCDVRIVLAKDNPAYASALTRHCVISTKEVKETADTAAGVACAKEGAEKIIIKVANRSNADLIEVVCHEIVHKFQKQESVSSYDNIMWLCEGVARVIAASVAESLGLGPVRLDRQITCLKTIRAKSKFPSLTVLHSTKEWEATGEKYDLTITYCTAELAVFELAKRKGYKSIFQYFLFLKHYNNAQAFEMAFGMKLSEYENFFNRLLGLML